MSIDKLCTESALKLLFMADALTMPVHWYYNIKDIQHQFPGGIRLFEAAPAKHPSSIKEALQLIADTAASTVNRGFSRLLQAPVTDDSQVVGGKYSLAYYIDSSWPVVLCLAHKYMREPLQGLLQNTNLGVENCHRGAVLGTLLGAASGCQLELFQRLLHADAIQAEIQAATQRPGT